MTLFYIIYRELRANFKSLLIWCAIVILFTIVGFSKFSAYYQNPEMLAILDSMPPALLTAFNMNAFNLTTVTGFFGIMVSYFALILSLAAVMWGSDIISKEERDKTVEFSLSLPVTRSRLVTAKIIAAAVNCAVLLYVSIGIILIGAQSYQPDNTFYNFVFLAMLAFTFIQMIFLALGILLGCAIKNHKQAGSIAVSLMLAAYFISILSELNGDLKFLKYLSPFQYFNAVLLLREGGLERTFVYLSFAIAAVALAGAYTTYSKRDLYI